MPVRLSGLVPGVFILFHLIIRLTYFAQPAYTARMNRTQLQTTHIAANSPRPRHSRHRSGLSTAEYLLFMVLAASVMGLFNGLAMKYFGAICGAAVILYTLLYGVEHSLRAVAAWCMGCAEAMQYRNSVKATWRERLGAEPETVEQAVQAEQTEQIGQVSAEPVYAEPAYEPEYAQAMVG